MQRLLCVDQNDSLAGFKVSLKVNVVQTKGSNHIGGKLGQGGGSWWINFFKDLRDSGVYADHDPLHQECLKFCFMNVLRKELNSIAEMWNVKDIPSKKKHATFWPKTRFDVLSAVSL